MNQATLTEPTGLSTAEAQRLLRIEGPNVLPSSRPAGWGRILLRALVEPMILLLVVCAAVYLALGEPKDGLILLGSVLVVLSLTLYQEKKSENALAALRDLSSPRAMVIRDGVPQRVPGADIARGDVLLVYEGDRIPADARLLSTRYLRVDESMLTGESAPVLKNPSSDDSNRLYSGTLVTAGQGVALVEKTGAQTEIGKIGRSLNEDLGEDQTHLQRETKRLVRSLGGVGIGCSVFVAVFYSWTHGEWLKGLLAGLAAAMSLLPEELPVVLAVFLAIGAWRMSRVKVLVRHVSATEALGSVTVLCVDKTGTLTENRMRLRELWAEGQELELPLAQGLGLPEHYHALIEYGALACHVDPYDPMEIAIRQALDALLSGTEHVHQDWRMIREYPLSYDLLAMSCVWKDAANADLIVASKGAPEAIMDLCRIQGHERSLVLNAVEAMSNRGLRLLGVAQARFKGGTLPERPQGFDFRFVGLIGMEDPIRPEVPSAIRECRDAGVRVMMMTGDHAGTAIHVAKKLGMRADVLPVVGRDMMEMDDSELSRKLLSSDVIARVKPDQKSRIVESLRASGAIVAMTGDGVNDAPSLRRAHVGIAMGQRGTDVAREAADIVLLDDRFDSIVQAIRSGRRIFENVRKAIGYIISVHIPIAGISIVPVLLGWPLVLLPVHIVLLELIIDPACALVFEAEPDEPALMKRPPRSIDSRLVERRQWIANIVSGLFVFVAVFASYAIARSVPGASEGSARTAAFMGLALGNLGLIWVNRVGADGALAALRRKNIAFTRLIALVSVGLACMVGIPALRALFSLTVLSAFEWITTLSAVSLSLTVAAFVQRRMR